MAVPSFHYKMYKTPELVSSPMSSQEEAMQQGMILSGEIFRKVKENPKLTNRQISEEVHALYPN